MLLFCQKKILVKVTHGCSKLLKKNKSSISSLSSWPKRKFQILDGSYMIDDSEKQLYYDQVELVNQKYNSKLQQVLAGGGDSAIMRHTVRNSKLLARKRIELLVDKDYPLLEIGMFAGLGLDYGDICCAGMVSVIGKISGQLCIISANDATVKGGTIYPIGVKKQDRMQEIAAENNLPCVYLIDSGGGFLPLQAEVFNPGGKIFYNEAVMNAAGIPQICLVAGSCTAGAAYIPTMANEVIMVDKISSIFLAGPPLVYTAIGEQVSEQDLGGSSVHCDVSGCADYKAKDEYEAIEMLKDVMSTLNIPLCMKEQHMIEQPIYNVDELDILQFIRDTEGRMLIRQIISRIFDGSRFHEYKPSYGKEVVAGFAHLNGVLVGILANNGTFSKNSCLKACNFLSLCDYRGIPIVFLQDVQQDMNTVDNSLIKYIGEVMTAVATAIVPKITLVMGKSFGAGNFAMCGRSMSPRFLFTWPDTKLFIQDISCLSDKQDIEKFQLESDCFYGSGRLWDDGVILPKDTRKVLSLALLACLSHKSVENSPHKSVLRM